MARIDDGELYLEIEGATEEQLHRGLVAARKSLLEAGVNIRAAFAAQTRVDEAGLSELAWEQGLVDEPDSPSDEDMALSDALDEASWAATQATRFSPGGQLVISRFGLVDTEQKAEQAPVVRDLFEPAE